MDTEFDVKMDTIEAVYGNDIMVVIKLWQLMFREECHEIDISRPEYRMLLAKRANVPIDRWEEIIKLCVQVRLFDPIAFDERHVLASNGARKRIEQINRERAKWRRKKQPGAGEESPEGFSPGENPVVSGVFPGGKQGGKPPEHEGFSPGKRGEMETKIETRNTSNGRDGSDSALDAHAHEGMPPPVEAGTSTGVSSGAPSGVPPPGMESHAELNPFDTRVRQPTLEEVVAFGQRPGIDISRPEVEEIYHSYAKVGWLDQHGRPIMRWDSALIGAAAYRRRSPRGDSKHGRAHQSPAGAGRTSSYEERATIRADTVDDSRERFWRDHLGDPDIGAT